MNVNFRTTSNLLAQNAVRRFLEGGPMPQEDPNAMPPEGAPAPSPEEAPNQEGAPAPELEPQLGGADLLAQIAQLLVQMLMQQIGDPNAVMQILQIALDMVQQGGQGAPAPQEEPVYKAGGRLIYRIRK